MKTTSLILAFCLILCLGRAAAAQEDEAAPQTGTMTEAETAPETQGIPPAETEEVVRVTPPPYLCISGLMPAGERPLAVVNEEVVEEGDVIDGARIVTISAHEVTFEYQGDTFTKTIGQGCRVAQPATAPTTVTPQRTTASRRRPRSMPSFSSSTGELTDAQAGAVTAVFVVMWIVWFAFYVYMAVALQTIATKTSTANGWFAWIPILNLYLMCDMANKSGWFMLLFFIPFINIIAFIMVWMGIAQARGKPSWLGLLMVLPVANIVIPGYLAFSR